MAQVRAELITAGVIAMLVVADFVFNDASAVIFLFKEFLRLSSFVAFWQ